VRAVATDGAAEEPVAPLFLEPRGLWVRGRPPAPAAVREAEPAVALVFREPEALQVQERRPAVLREVWSEPGGKAARVSFAGRAEPLI